MALISWAIIAQLIWAIVFAYTKSRFSHDAAHLLYSLLICKPKENNLPLQNKVSKSNSIILLNWLLSSENEIYKYADKNVRIIFQSFESPVPMGRRKAGNIVGLYCSVFASALFCIALWIRGVFI